MKHIFRFFSGEVELSQVWSERRELVASKFPGVALKRVDSFDVRVGLPKGQPYDGKTFLPVTRVIDWNAHGSKHECGPKCRSAKGSNCECSCRGEFHGVDA